MYIKSVYIYLKCITLFNWKKRCPIFRGENPKLQSACAPVHLCFRLSLCVVPEGGTEGLCLLFRWQGLFLHRQR